MFFVSVNFSREIFTLTGFLTVSKDGVHVLAGTVARTCKDGCTYLRGQIFSPQTFTMTDANVCKGGCKRLRLRGAKLELKSSVLFWTRKRRLWDHNGFLRLVEASPLSSGVLPSRQQYMIEDYPGTPPPSVYQVTQGTALQAAEYL